MASIGLETIVSCLPETVVHRDDFAYLDVCMSDEERAIFERPAQMRRLRGEDAVERTAERVAQKALDRAGLRTSDIDFIIASNIGGKYQASYVGTWIHHQLGFDQETPVLNVFNACASFLDGLNIAWHLVRAGEYERVLVVMVTAWDIQGEGLVDPISPLAGIFGDGAGAAIVSRRNLKCEFLSYLSRTWGELYDHIAVRFGPVMHPELTEAAGTRATHGNDLRVSRYAAVDWLQATGRRFAIEGIEKAARKAGLGVEDIDIVIFHQGPHGAVQPWIDGAVERGMRRQQFRHTYDKYGNVGNIDIGLTLTELGEANEIRKGSHIALVGMAGGGHAPTLILRWLE